MVLPVLGLGNFYFIIENKNSGVLNVHGTYNILTLYRPYNDLHLEYYDILVLQYIPIPISIPTIYINACE